MRPIALKMTAFGPYAKEVELNFKEELSNQDIFVITGPTGAGKTTIFDGICYALYGETSGAKRRGEELRSDFSAKGDLKTEVMFTFSVKDKKYTITRAPKQQKKKKRGEGMTEVPASVELIEHESDRAPLTKDNEIKQVIQEIIGLNVDQFRKIVMIPQGDFKEFLYANTMNKEELLRKIFGTDIYKRVQEQLHENSTKLKSEIAQIQKEIYANLSILKNEETSDFKKLLEENKPLQEILGKLEKQITIFYQKEKEAEEKFNENEKSLKEKMNDRQAALLLNEKFQQQKNAQERLQQLEALKTSYTNKEKELMEAKEAEELLRLEDEVLKMKTMMSQLKETYQVKQEQLIKMQHEFLSAQKAYEEVSLKQIQIKKLIEEESKLKIHLQDVKKLKENKKELNHFIVKQEHLKKILEEKKDMLVSITLQVQLLEEKQELIQEIKEKILALQLEISQTENQQKEIEKATKHYIVSEKFLEESEQLTKHYTDLQKESDDLRLNYEHQSSLFINATAIRLANELEIGQACPVCGSKEHPNLRKSNEKILTQEELNQLRENLNDFNDTVQECWQKVVTVRSRLTEELRLFQEYSELIKMNCPQLQEIELEGEILKKLKLKIEEKISNQKLNLKRDNEKLNQLQKEINELFKLDEKKNKVVEEITEIEKNSQEATVKILTLKETLKEMLMRVPEEFHVLEALETTIKGIMTQRLTIEEEIKTDEATYQKAIKELTILQTTIENLEKQLQNGEKNYENAEQLFTSGVIKFFNQEEIYQKAKRTREEIQKLTQEIQHYNQNIHTATHQLNQLSIALENKEKKDIESLTVEIDKLEQIKEEKRQQINECQIHREHHEKILKASSEKYKLIKRQEENYATIGELAELANGRTAGKMTFETYVLSSYFDEVLEAANYRLKKITNGRYYLLRREEIKGGGRKGLDLDVYDSHTSKKRPVNTLSGGESFKASLALALGLSDTVQQNAGGVQLDTMFIDEGFGTLDSESLEQAIDILMDLQDHGRLIGVISHVNELKERIPAKLVVQSSSEGSIAFFQ